MATSAELAFEWGGRTIHLDVQRQARATLRVAVTPEGSVKVWAPEEAEDAAVLERVRRCAAWIGRQLSYFERWQPRTPPRQFETGETHLYLGRAYRLLVRGAERRGVHIDGGRIARCSLARHACRAPVQTWYRSQAHRVFRERLALVEPPFVRAGVPRPTMIIRQLERRWGSYTARGNLVLNLDLVRASPHLIDYVIAHELAHGLVPDHSERWREALGRVVPDWVARKDELERQLL